MLFVSILLISVSLFLTFLFLSRRATGFLYVSLVVATFGSFLGLASDAPVLGTFFGFMITYIIAGTLAWFLYLATEATRREAEALERVLKSINQKTAGTSCNAVQAKTETNTNGRDSIS